jgi:small-conductance mechanosensitive channel
MWNKKEKVQEAPEMESDTQSAPQAAAIRFSEVEANISEVNAFNRKWKGRVDVLSSFVSELEQAKSHAVNIMSQVHTLRLEQQDLLAKNELLKKQNASMHDSNAQSIDQLKAKLTDERNKLLIERHTLEAQQRELASRQQAMNAKELNTATAK